MKKSLESTGPNGTYRGIVEIFFDYRTESREVHNPSTHDEEKRMFSYHRVVGYVEGHQTPSEDFLDKRDAPKYCEQIEKIVMKKLYSLANDQITATYLDILKSNGYK